MDIVEEIRQDREKGAKRLVEEYKAGLMSLARRFVPNETDAEELVNVTFAKAAAERQQAHNSKAAPGCACFCAATIWRGGTPHLPRCPIRDLSFAPWVSR